MRTLPAKAHRITPPDEHWFFGYYDIPAFAPDESKHLALKVPFMDRLPTANDVAELYAINLLDGSTSCIGSTRSWNFQQGCFAQWIPAIPNTVIWNVQRDGGCGYGAIIKNLATGEERQIDRPVATVAPDGKHDMSINLDRLYNFRPGYGYAKQRDPWFNENHPADDGIYLTDLQTGTSKLVLSLDALWTFTKDYFGGVDQKICVNHINFNTDGSRFVFLLRNFSESGWKTATLTAKMDGSELYLLSDYAYASHYYWVDAHTLSIHSSGKELGNLGDQLYELTDLCHEGHAVDPDFFLADGHVSYSPNREWVLYDSYPKEDGCRELYLYDLKTRRGGLLGRYKIMPYSLVDLRCDLHPVWGPSGERISFDSVHEGFRGIYTMELQDAMSVLRTSQNA